MILINRNLTANLVGVFGDAIKSFVGDNKGCSQADIVKHLGIDARVVSIIISALVKDNILFGMFGRYSCCGLNH